MHTRLLYLHSCVKQEFVLTAVCQVKTDTVKSRRDYGSLKGDGMYDILVVIA